MRKQGDFMKNEDIVSRWMNGGTYNGNSISIGCDERAIWSYGLHFVMALRLNHTDFLVNRDSYSNTTSKHQSLVIDELNSRGKNLIWCSTKEIKRAYDYPDSPVVLEQRIPITNTDEALDSIARVWKKSKYHFSPFPRQKINDYIAKLEKEAVEREQKRRIGTVTMTYTKYNGEVTNTFALRKIKPKEIVATNIEIGMNIELKKFFELYDDENTTKTTDMTPEQIEEIRTQLLIQGIKK
jgi:hypothetical protein